MEKLKSRKFWICVAAFLGSIATSIAGLCTDNQTITTIGIVCGVISAAIYAFCEAWVDAKAIDTEDIARALFNLLIDEQENSNEETEDEDDCK